MLECKYKYSIERYNNKTQQWEIEYRFYYAKFKHLENYKNNDLFRNLKFIDKMDS